VSGQDPAPICQWCGLPTLGTPTYWDGKPQCGSHIACANRLAKQEKTR
jgi:hypothetical protein